jgi:DNA polymerase
MKHYSLDFETTSRIDLRQVGAPRYANDVSTRVLCWSIADLAKPADISSVTPSYTRPDASHDFTAQPIPAPEWVQDAATGVAVIHAYNAAFEWFVLNFTCTRLFGWPEIPATAMRCTLAQARYWGYSGKLDETSRALGAPPKDMAGHKLMMKMNKPRNRPKNTWWDEDQPELLDELVAYCEDDVRAEMGVASKLPALPASEQRIYELDMRVNMRGVRIDRVLVPKLVEATKSAVEQLNADVAALTDGRVHTTNQVAKLKDEVNADLQAAGQMPVESLDKNALTELFARPYLPPKAKALATARRTAAKSSTAKLQRMLDAAGGLLQYYGAARTGRWAGRIVQPQNLPRGAMKNPIGAADLVVTNMCGVEDVADDEGIDVMTMASSMIRTCIVPDEYEQGGVLLAPDYGQIEARKIAWLAGQQDVLDVFARGEDVYVYTAKQIGSDDRQLGKVAALGLGFGMGPGTFVESAKGYGLELDLQMAEDVTYGWRNANSEIVALWYDLESAAKKIANNQARRVKVGERLTVEMAPNAVDPRKKDVHIVLPSTRRLVYPRIRIAPHPMHGRDSLCFDGLNPVTGKFSRVFTYGGKLAENVTQAAARDVMALALVKLEDWGVLGTPLLTVHDEAILDVPARLAGSKLADVQSQVEQIMRFELGHKPAWLDGLPLKVDADVKRRYAK